MCVVVGAYEIHYCKAVYAFLQTIADRYIPFSCDGQYFTGLWTPRCGLYISLVDRIENTSPLRLQKAESDLLESTT